MARTRPESFPPDSARGPLGGTRVAVSGAPEAGALSALLESAGARVFRFEQATPSEERVVERWLGALVAGEFDDVVFFSAQGVRLVCEMARQLGRESAVFEALRGTRLIAEGGRTARALAEFGLAAAARSAKPGAGALLQAAVALGIGGRVVALQPRGSPSDSGFALALERAGAIVRGADDQASPDTSAGEILDRILSLGVDTLVLFGSSQVAWLWDGALTTGRAGALRETLATMAVVASESAAEALRDRGVRARAVPARLLRGSAKLEDVRALFQSPRRAKLAEVAPVATRLLVVGDGAVAREFSEYLARLDRTGGFQVLVLAEDQVTQLDCDRQLVLTGGEAVPYEILVLATGSAAVVPPLPGTDKRGVLVYRTAKDLEAVASVGAQQDENRVVAIVGAGLGGLEAAESMSRRGFAVHLVSSTTHLLPELLDGTGAEVLRRKLSDRSVTVHLGRSVARVNGEEHVTGIRFGDGGKLDADLVILVAGARPRDDLARAAGLDVGASGGIVVDDEFRTSDPRVYAIGECASHAHASTPQAGKELARVLGRRLAGTDDSTSPRLVASSAYTLFGIDVASIGNPFADVETGRSIVFSDVTRGFYKKLAVWSDGKTLLGAVLVGDTTDFRELVRASESGKFMSVWRAPRSTDGGDGNTHRLCEHFDFDPIELREIVLVKRLRTFDALLAEYGVGPGCDTCRTEIAGVLADSHSELLVRHEEPAETTPEDVAARGFAVRLGERYAGVRLPRAVKGFVAARLPEGLEPDEADFGIVATELGHRIYLYGDGAKPRPAVLLATDLEEEMVIRYMDRLIMFAIQTATDTPRVSSWTARDIEHVRDVVVRDKLRLANALENQMQRLLDANRAERSAPAVLRSADDPPRHAALRRNVAASM